MAVTGIIRPPPDIRAVADKTALFVAKNGRAFEQRILNSGKGQTPKFAFLHDNSPFHAYYEEKIQFYSEGGTDEKKDDKDAAGKKEGKGGDKKDQQPTVIQKAAVQAEKKSALDPMAKALLTQRNKIRSQYDEAEKAKKEAFTKDEAADEPKKAPSKVLITPPPRLHFINITAPSNLTAPQVETIKLVAQFIALDESKNFLQNLTIREWNNPTFAFLQPRHSHFAYFSALTDCYKYIIQTAVLKKDGFQRKSLQDCLDLAAYRAEYDRDAEERNQGNNTAEEDLANAIDWHDFVLVETIDFAQDETVQPLVMPTSATEVDGMDVSDDEDGDNEMIRVVPNYTPKVVASSQTSKSQTHVIDPITGKSVPAAQTSEHMRIQLLDPKWAEEKRKFQEKQKETNLVTGDMMASNLSRVVGDVSSATSGLHDADPRKRLAEANRVMREQAQQQQPGPRLPPPQQLPAAKRQRLNVPGTYTPGMVPPGMPPPPLPHGMPPGMPPPGMPPQGMPPGMPPPGMPPGMPPPGMPPSMLPPGMPPGMPPPGLPPGMPPPGMPPTGMPPVPPPGMPPPGMPPAPPLDPVAPTDEILSEEAFAASLESPIVALEISIPHDPSNIAWNFHGQSVAMKVDVMTTIKAVKEELSGHLNKMNTNKLQLKHSTQGFLKDSMTLATLNLGPLASLEMVPKTRGRRK